MGPAGAAIVFLALIYGSGTGARLARTEEGEDKPHLLINVDGTIGEGKPHLLVNADGTIGEGKPRLYEFFFFITSAIHSGA